MRQKLQHILKQIHILWLSTFTQIKAYMNFSEKSMLLDFQTLFPLVAKTSKFMHYLFLLLQLPPPL